jgi:hypothetical protein
VVSEPEPEPPISARDAQEETLAVVMMDLLDIDGGDSAFAAAAAPENVSNDEDDLLNM